MLTLGDNPDLKAISWCGGGGGKPSFCITILPPGLAGKDQPYHRTWNVNGLNDKLFSRSSRL